MDNINLGLIIFFFVLSVIYFIFAGYFIYISKIKLERIPKEIKKEIGTFVKINAPLIIKNYNFEDVINRLDLLIDCFNNTNKRVNIATSAVTFIAGLGSLASAIIILIYN